MKFGFVALVGEKRVGDLRIVFRCTDRADGHRCSQRNGHEGAHRAFGKEWKS